MRHTLLLIVTACLAGGCTANEGTHNVDDSKGQVPSVRRMDAPAVSPPLCFRQQNWTGNEGEGCCVYATLCTLLNLQGRPQTADYVKANFGNGATPTELAKVGIRYAETFKTVDVGFLEWSLATGRGCGVSCSALVNGKRQYFAHCVALIHLDDKHAITIDSNFPAKLIIWDREEFLIDWALSKSWAFTPLYSPPAPDPL